MLEVAWHGDAGVETGFGRVTTRIVERLLPRFDINIYAINWRGDQLHQGRDDVLAGRMWAARSYPDPGDVYGFHRMPEFLAKHKPDVLVVLNDLPVINEILQNIPHDLPVMGYFPIDCVELPQWWLRPLRRLNSSYTFTEFGRQEIQKADPLLDPGVIPHGIDTAVFHPLSVSAPAEVKVSDGSKLAVTSREQARALLGLGDRFVVLYADRNSQRKNPQEFFRAVAPFCRAHPDAFIWLHTAAQDEGGDINIWIERFGLGRQVRFSQNQNTFDGVPEYDLNLIYNVADVRVTTSMGEGFGLIGGEVAAAGTAQIAQDFTCFREVIGPGALYVDSVHSFMSQRGVDLGYPSVGQITDCLETLYRDDSLRRQLGKAGRAHVLANFNWDKVAEQFGTAIRVTAAQGTSSLLERLEVA